MTQAAEIPWKSYSVSIPFVDSGQRQYGYYMLRGQRRLRNYRRPLKHGGLTFAGVLAVRIKDAEDHMLDQMRSLFV